MTVDDVPEVVKFYYQLAYFIKDETGDEYFDFDLSRETGLEKYLLESIGSPHAITFVAKDDGKAIAFISGEVRDCCLPISIS